MLDGNHFSGSSPEDKGSGFECKSCSPSRPLHYFVFARSDLNSLVPNGDNQVFSIVPSGEGVRVFTTEAVSSEPTISAMGIFEFYPDFRLQRASHSDGYRELHRRFEREGRIYHPWEKCPDRFGPRLIRSWDPQRGWTEIQPLAANN